MIALCGAGISQRRAGCYAAADTFLSVDDLLSRKKHLVFVLSRHNHDPARVSHYEVAGLHRRITEGYDLADRLGSNTVLACSHVTTTAE